jgi:hypothetical protein
VHAARIARLEDLLARVRANAAMGPPIRARERTSERVLIDPTIDEEIDEIDRAALRQSLERHIEVALGDAGPTVPFAEEVEGWEPEPLELERDDGPRLLRRRDADIDLVDVAIPSAPRAPAIEPDPEPELEPELKRITPVPVALHEPKQEEEPEPSELGRVLEEAARARGEIDPRAIWDGLAGQLRGRRASGVRAAVKAETDAKTRAAPEPSAPAAPPEPAPAPASIPKPAASSRRHRAPTSGRGGDAAASAPVLGLDFDDAPPVPAPPSSGRGLAELSPISRPSQRRLAEAAKRRSRPSAPDLVVALDQIAELGPPPDDDDDARPSRKRWARGSRRRLGARPTSSGSRRWLWVAIAAALAAAAIALYVAAPWQQRTPAGDASASQLGTAVGPARPRPSVEPTGPTRAAATGAATTARPTATTVLSPTLPQPGAPPVEELTETEGWLRVEGGEPLAVYLNGNLAGNVGEWIRTPCGVHFLRLARKDPPRPGASFPTWLDDGDSLVIPCRGSTSVAAPK